MDSQLRPYKTRNMPLNKSPFEDGSVSSNITRDHLLEAMQGKSATECVEIAMLFMKRTVLDLKEMHLLPPFNGAMSSSERRQLYQALSRDDSSEAAIIRRIMTGTHPGMS